MNATNNRQSYERLRDAILSFVEAHPHPAVRPFKSAIANWGQTWAGVQPIRLPAADLLTPALAVTTKATQDLVALFETESDALKWEQSYTRADGVVGDDMLSGYGFAEVIGRHGPFVSARVRAGIGVWGPHIDYPAHRHAAEEVYVVLAGSADFRLGDKPPEARTAGDTVHVPAMLTHGFHTNEEPFVVFYIWQSGDLREKSSFS
ncbi:MAG: dimethylsulfonioproprionate lyase family protein [Aestuariivirgaceae bacterium]